MSSTNSSSEARTWQLRLACEPDESDLDSLIAVSARELLAPYYSHEQIAAAMGPIFGVDLQLIRDGTYFVAEIDAGIVGCGGWSRRRALFGGSSGRADDDNLLDPQRDAARVRAFFVHPAWARRGIGRAIMEACEEAIVRAGFRTVDIVATLGGEPLYASFDYSVVERYEIPMKDGLKMPAVRMTKRIGEQWRVNCRVAYEVVADEYVRRISDELQHKPLDRELLDRFAASVRDSGPMCDVGCGPGHITRYLHERGVRVCGMDLSPAMIERAKELNSGIEFFEGDMMALKAVDGTWSGITAFYSIIHIPRTEMRRALAELRRVLRPGGLLLLAFHIGDDAVHMEEWWGRKVHIDFFFLRPGTIADDLRAVGFEVDEIVERDPYPEVEHQSRRAYIFARRPA